MRCGSGSNSRLGGGWAWRAGCSRDGRVRHWRERMGSGWARTTASSTSIFVSGSSLSLSNVKAARRRLGVARWVVRGPSSPLPGHDVVRGPAPPAPLWSHQLGSHDDELAYARFRYETRVSSFSSSLCSVVTVQLAWCFLVLICGDWFGEKEREKGFRI